MRYLFTINQIAVHEMGLIGIIKSNHCAVLETIIAMYGYPKTERLIHEGDCYIWAAPKLVAEQMPMFELSPQRIKQLIIDLCEVNLLERHPDNEKLIRFYVKFGSAYEKYQSYNADPLKNYPVPVKKLTGKPVKILIAEDGNNKDGNRKEDIESLVDSVFDIWNEICAPQSLKKTGAGNRKLFKKALENGFDLDDCRMVIKSKYDAWINDAKMRHSIQPSTLFRESHFENYLNVAKLNAERVDKKDESESKPSELSVEELMAMKNK